MSLLDSARAAKSKAKVRKPTLEEVDFLVAFWSEEISFPQALQALKESHSNAGYWIFAKTRDALNAGLISMNVKRL